MTWEEHVEAVRNDRPGFPGVAVVWAAGPSFGIGRAEKAETTARLTTTVGYLVSQTDDSISVVLHINTDHVGNGAVIPVSAILSWRDLT